MQWAESRFRFDSLEKNFLPVTFRNSLKTFGGSQCNKGVNVWNSIGYHLFGVEIMTTLATLTASRINLFCLCLEPTCSITAEQKAKSNTLSLKGKVQASAFTKTKPGYWSSKNEASSSPTAVICHGYGYSFSKKFFVWLLHRSSEDDFPKGSLKKN